MYDMKTQNNVAVVTSMKKLLASRLYGPPVTLSCHKTHAESLLFGLCHHLFIFDTWILLGNFPSNLGFGVATSHVPSGLLAKILLVIHV
jgi:hypothetical protein